MSLFNRASAQGGAKSKPVVAAANFPDFNSAVAAATKASEAGGQVHDLAIVYAQKCKSNSPAVDQQKIASSDRPARFHGARSKNAWYWRTSKDDVRRHPRPGLANELSRALIRIATGPRSGVCQPCAARITPTDGFPVWHPLLANIAIARVPAASKQVSRRRDPSRKRVPPGSFRARAKKGECWSHRHSGLTPAFVCALLRKGTRSA